MKHVMHVQINKGRLNQTLKTLTEAIETIYQCYSELENMGVLVVDEADEKEDTVSGN